MVFSTIEAAQVEKFDLIERITSIDLQLTQRAAEVVGRVPDGQYQQYLQWKARALGAKKVLVSKLQRTKSWINQQRQKEAEERFANRGGNSDGLLSDLYALTKALVVAGAVVDHSEQCLLDDVGSYLETN